MGLYGLIAARHCFETNFFRTFNFRPTTNPPTEGRALSVTKHILI